jgi:hypothetical protein
VATIATINKSLEKTALTDRLREVLSHMLDSYDMFATLTKIGDLTLDLLFGGARWGILLSPILFSLAAPAMATESGTFTQTNDVIDVGERAPALSPSTVGRCGPLHIISDSEVDLLDAGGKAS